MLDSGKIIEKVILKKDDPLNYIGIYEVYEICKEIEYSKIGKSKHEVCI